MTFCLSFCWNFIDYFNRTLKSHWFVLFYYRILIGWEKDDLEEKIVRFVNKSHHWEPIRCKHNQWFQNGFNKYCNHLSYPRFLSLFIERLRFLVMITWLMKNMNTLPKNITLVNVHLGLGQTPHFTWAESNANEKNPLFSLIKLH